MNHVLVFRDPFAFVGEGRAEELPDYPNTLSILTPTIRLINTGGPGEENNGTQRVCSQCLPVAGRLCARGNFNRSVLYLFERK